MQPVLLPDPAAAREVAVEDFCVGPGRNVLSRGELLVALTFPAPKPHSGAAYLRFIPRNEMDIAVVGVGVSIELDEAKSKAIAARVSLGAVAPRPLLVKSAADALIGTPVSEASIENAAAQAQAAASPISDMRGDAEYRRHLVRVLVKRALATAIDRAKVNGGV